MPTILTRQLSTTILQSEGGLILSMVVFHPNRIGIWMKRGANLGVDVKITKHNFSSQSVPRITIASRVTTSNLPQLLSVYQQLGILFHPVLSSKMDPCQICRQFHRNPMDCECSISLHAHNLIYFSPGPWSLILGGLTMNSVKYSSARVLFRM